MAESGTLGTTTRRMIDGSQRPPPLDSAAILGGGLTLTSPAGSLTFVSSPFADQNYYINPESLTSPPGLESRPSFSPLLAGAMDSPAAIPFESLHKEASFRDYSTEKSSDFGFSHQLFSGSGSGSVFSPAFFSTSAPANVTLQTAFAQSRPTATEHTVSQRVPATDAFQYQPHAHKRTHNPYFVNADKPADDGYNWRKYGQKPVKGCEFPRSYYKCTSTGCPVKKKVERSSDGQITQIIYKGQHNHGKPQNRRGRETGSFSGFGAGANMDPYQAAGSRESDNSEERRNGWYIGDDDGDDHEGDDDDEEDGDGRASKIRKIEGYSGVSTCHRTVTEPKIIVQTRSEVDLLDDGYRWRKYGQKVVKGNPHPRSYYKCTTVGCTVRKHIERAATDSKAVMTTYEGKHNHDLPTARASSNAQKVKPSTDGVSLLNDIGFGNSGRGSVILRLKEEKITVR